MTSMDRALNYFGGHWTAGAGAAGDCINPATSEVAAQFSDATLDEALPAIEAARAAFDTGPWSRSPRRREAVLLEFAANLQARAPEIEHWLVTLNGKLAREARGEIATAVSELRFYAGLARNLWGRVAEIDNGCYSQLSREPAGVAAIIVPWNAPVILLIRSLAPALAAGCTVVIKAAHQTSMVNQLALECLTRITTLPSDVVCSFTESGAAIGRAISQSPHIDVISFTGSSATGKRIAAEAAGTLKRLSLELGGKAPAIVLPDAPVEATVAGLVAGALPMAGQQCTAIARVLLHQDRFDEMAAALATRLAALVLGPGHEPASQLGPLIDLGSRDRLARLAAEASSQGKVWLQGGVPAGPLGRGAFVSPTLVEVSDLGSRYVRHELFGPVLVIERYGSRAEAIERANATRYGLAASVWTTDRAAGQAMARELKSGTVWLNTHNKLYPEVETGGFRESGYGRLHGVEGLNDFLSTKHVYW
ncbi:MAG: aldehyde dehydrogenase family protein, partial [Rubrivivax sp.]